MRQCLLASDAKPTKLRDVSSGHFLSFEPLSLGSGFDRDSGIFHEIIMVQISNIFRQFNYKKAKNLHFLINSEY